MRLKLILISFIFLAVTPIVALAYLDEMLGYSPIVDHVDAEMLEFTKSCAKHDAELYSVTDGDTGKFHIALGFDIYLESQKVRMFGINTPESRTRNLVEKEAGLRAKAKLAELLNAANKIQLCVRPKKPRGKYGRILAVIYADSVNVNSLMIKQGYGIPYYGGKRSSNDFDFTKRRVYNEAKGETAQ